MSAAPLFDVSVHRFGREEHVLRLGDGDPTEAPTAERDPPVLAVREPDPWDVLHSVARLLQVVGRDPEELLLNEVLRITRKADKDLPRLLKALERELHIRNRAFETKNLKKARGEGESATGKKRETHLKELGRLFASFKRVGGDPKDLALWWLALDEVERAEQGSETHRKACQFLEAVRKHLSLPAFEKLERKAVASHVGQLQVSQEKGSTSAKE